MKSYNFHLLTINWYLLKQHICLVQCKIQYQTPCGRDISVIWCAWMCHESMSAASVASVWCWRIRIPACWLRGKVLYQAGGNLSNKLGALCAHVRFIFMARCQRTCWQSENITRSLGQISNTQFVGNAPMSVHLEGSNILSTSHCLYVKEAWRIMNF